jgi:lipopolysaccharide biosynthesis glycosyltransferase
MAIGLACHGEQGAETAVVFACDRNYLRFAAFAAAQIASLTPERRFDICLCAPDEALEPVPGLAGLGLRYCRVSTGGIFGGLAVDTRRTAAMYLRLALPEAFEGQYRRLLYLDSDVFVQGGDFAGLLGADIGGRAVAAVLDNLQWRSPRRRPLEFRRLGVPAATPYLNSGVLLVDTAAYRRDGVLERCREVGRSHPEALSAHDQSMLNLALKGAWSELSPVWNWQYTRASMLFEAMEGAHVVHFIGAKKPWGHTGGALPPRFGRAYRAFFAEHFPDAPAFPAEGLAPHQNRGYLRAMLLRHYFAVGGFADYLDRFPDELTVIPRR